LSDVSKTVADSMEETKERHKRYLRAVNNPVRREILRAIQQGNDELESISEVTKVDEKTLNWHLRILEDGFCVERTLGGDPVRYILTKEGSVVDFLDK
jgi:DNA-binding transcriptional ArsR family regulator